MRKCMTLSLVLILIISTLVSAAQIDLSNATIVVLSPKKKIMTNAADMLGDEINKRTRITLDVVSHMPQADKVAIIIGTAKELAEKTD